MSDVTETLQELLERRLRELGHRSGRDEQLSLREAWMRLPENEAGERKPTYEAFRRIRQDGHTNITDETADALATMLEVTVDEVLAAAGQRPRLGRFELPRRADRLSSKERDAVLGVVDAILQASAAEATRTKASARVDISTGTRLHYLQEQLDLELRRVNTATTKRDRQEATEMVDMIRRQLELLRARQATSREAR